MRSWFVAGLVLLAAAVLGAAALAAEPLVCPAGTKRQSGAGDLKGGLKEWCVDSSTGLKEGPERQFRADGSLLATSTNSHGKAHGTGDLYGGNGEKIGESTFDEKGVLVSQRMTLEGLKSVVNHVNKVSREQKRPFILEAIDLHTLAFEVRHESAIPNEGFDRYLRENPPRNPEICQMFQIQGVNIETIRVHYVNGKQETLGRTTIARDDCAATPGK
jgi:hypothetical protein